MGIYNKLATIQKELIAPKGQFNAFGKYAYRSCEDILKALKPLCDENGCLVYITNDLENIGGENYVKAIVSFVDLESGEQITSSAHAREEKEKKGMDGSQITGSSSSYARKYALAGLFCIDNEKDSDATNQGDSQPKQTNTPAKQNKAPNEANSKPQPAPENVNAVAEADFKTKVLAFINRHNMSKENIEKLCKAYKVESLSQLTAQHCQHYINALEKRGGNINE